MKDIAIIAVGGYNEIGRNMTAIRIGKDIVVMDMGIRLDRVQIHEDTDVESLHAADLINMGAIPDDSIMENVDGKVRAIACTHGHLDHIGAISKLAHKYHAPIIASPFTADLINQEIKSEKIFGVKNPLHVMKAGERFPGYAGHRAGVHPRAAQHCGLRLRGHSYSQGHHSLRQ